MSFLLSIYLCIVVMRGFRLRFRSTRNIYIFYFQRKLLVLCDDQFRSLTDLINKLSTIDPVIPTNSILFCFDVEKLYSSVPRTEGLQACKEALNHRTQPDSTDLQRP